MGVLLVMQCLVTAGRVSQSATICIVAYGRFLGGVTPHVYRLKRLKLDYDYFHLFHFYTLCNTLLLLSSRVYNSLADGLVLKS